MNMKLSEKVTNCKSLQELDNLVVYRQDREYYIESHVSKCKTAKTNKVKAKYKTSKYSLMKYNTSTKMVCFHNVEEVDLKALKTPFKAIHVNTFYPQTVKVPLPVVAESVDALNQKLNWASSQLNIKEIHSYTTGRGVTIGVIDTGYAHHVDLADPKEVYFTIGSDYEDKDGHGTAVRGVISMADNTVGFLGISPDSEVITVKVLEGGRGSDNSVADGIRILIDSKVDIINGSLGSSVSLPLTAAAIRDARAQGILCVFASGNEYPDKVNFPARIQSAIAVGAHDINGNVAPFSNQGPEINLTAPGVNLTTSTGLNDYEKVSGTSFAAPVVAGVLALILSAYRERGVEPTYEQMISALEQSTDDFGRLTNEYLILNKRVEEEKSTPTRGWLAKLLDLIAMILGVK